MAYPGTNQSCCSSVIKHHSYLPHQPSSECYYWEMNGTINEAFSESSLDLSTSNKGSQSNNQPSLFYVDDSNNWMDKTPHHHQHHHHVPPVVDNQANPRFTEHWLDLENPVDGYYKRCFRPFSSASKAPSSSSSFNLASRCNCQKICFYCVPLIVTLSLFGLILIIGIIIYLETYARQVDYHSHEYTSGRRPFDLRSSNANIIG